MTRRRASLRSSRRDATPRDRWLVSYADFMTLLFAFFTVLYASSTVDARKFATMARAVQGAFADPRGAHGEASAGVAARQSRSGAPQSATDPALPGLTQQITDLVGTRLDTGQVDLRLDTRGLVISIREAGTFATASADVTPDTDALVRDLANALRQCPNAIRVEGHTDDRPISTSRFDSNWDLSTARATAIVSRLIRAGVEPSRISAAGYGEFRPRVANDTDANRASNRRVDIVVLGAAIAAQEEPARVERAGSAR